MSRIEKNPNELRVFEEPANDSLPVGARLAT
jgi:hypothetical protein